ncbi:MAG: endonuclease/exonuclease/phosphatase family protein [bacterium]
MENKILSSLGFMMLATIINAAPLRVATFNTSLNFPHAGDIKHAMQNCQSARAQKIAAIIQYNKPDLILLNEFDYDPTGEALNSFIKQCLNKSQFDQKPVYYSYSYTAAVNTGEPSHLDLNSDGKTETAADAWGFGLFPGQYGMVVLSKFPIQTDKIRTFQKFLWSDMPHALQPVKPSDGSPYYPASIWIKLRLSSKSLWDIPVKVGDKTLHFIASHPTPPVFDGPEDRNGHRNHDEIKLLADYIQETHSAYIYDDNGRKGGLVSGSQFVIVGDMNADPHDGDSTREPILQLLNNPAVNSRTIPTSSGAVEASRLQGQANLTHLGDPAQDTGDFNDKNPGNLRLDYVLPSNNISILDGAVFWPARNQTGSDWLDASDHHLVYLDIKL